MILFYIKFGRNVNLVRYIFAVLFALAHTLGQKIFYLSVDAAKIILCPGGYCIIQFCRYSQRYLFFVVCHNLVQAACVNDRLGIVVAAKHYQQV